MKEEKEQKKREDLEEENYEQNMDLWWRNYMSTMSIICQEVNMVI